MDHRIRAMKISPKEKREKEKRNARKDLISDSREKKTAESEATIAVPRWKLSADS